MDFFRKTIGGLNGSYYFRHFVFGALILFLFISIARQNPNGINAGSLIFCIANTMLYPYARFVYEKIVGFIMGDNVFWVNAILMLIVKFLTMVLCWVFAIFISPVGLAYLYYYHTKSAEKE